LHQKLLSQGLVKFDCSKFTGMKGIYSPIHFDTRVKQTLSLVSIAEIEPADSPIFNGHFRQAANDVGIKIPMGWAASHDACAHFIQAKREMLMARNGKHRKLDLCQNTSLIPYSNRAASGLSLQDQLIETKLRIEQVKLAELEAQLPDETSKQYTCYVDMPPPTPEDEAMFEAEFKQLLDEIFSQTDGPEEGQTVQDWLREQGAVIPDTPDWQTPLYLEKWVRA